MRGYRVGGGRWGHVGSTRDIITSTSFTKIIRSVITHLNREDIHILHSPESLIMVDFTGIDHCECKLIDCFDCQLWEQDQERQRRQEQAEEMERMRQFYMEMRRLPWEMRQIGRDSDNRRQA